MPIAIGPKGYRSGEESGGSKVVTGHFVLQNMLFAGGALRQYELCIFWCDTLADLAAGGPDMRSAPGLPERLPHDPAMEDLSVPEATMNRLAKVLLVATATALAAAPALAQSEDAEPGSAAANVTDDCADPAVVAFTITNIVRRMLGFDFRVTATIRNVGSSDWPSAGVIVVDRLPAGGGRAEEVDSETFAELAAGAEVMLTSAIQSAWQTDGPPPASFAVRIEYAEDAASGDCVPENNAMTLSGEEIQALLSAQE